MNCVVEEWSPDQARWPELVQVIKAEGQGHWAFNPYFDRFARHFLVALQEDRVTGFLMFVVWPIGPHDRDHPPVKMGESMLTEAKIIAFGVQQHARRQGIGRALQIQGLNRARELGCYQVRSVSEAAYTGNHQLKIALGFAVEPMEREEPCLAFVMPLKHWRLETDE